MKIEKFKKEVEAVFFDGITDVQEIAQWCGGLIVELVDTSGRLRADMYAIDVPCPGGFTTAGQNFYIFKDNRSFYAIDKHQFESDFDIIKE